MHVRFHDVTLYKPSSTSELCEYNIYYNMRCSKRSRLAVIHTKRHRRGLESRDTPVSDTLKLPKENPARVSYE